jgi:hypothetical protein
MVYPSALVMAALDPAIHSSVFLVWMAASSAAMTG